MRARLATLLVLWTAISPAAEPEVMRLMERISAQARVAAGYLRSDNADLGAVELERLQALWERDVAALPAIALDATLAGVLRDAGARFAQSRAAADRGDGDAAQAALNSAVQVLRDWRRGNGLRLFSDCIGEIGDAHGALDRWRLDPPNLGDAGLDTAIVAAAATSEAAVRRCDAEADGTLRIQPDFRRLVDGMLESLRQVPEAVRQRDAAYLHRLLIEQRSFERLLAFRFG